MLYLQLHSLPDKVSNSFVWFACSCRRIVYLASIPDYQRSMNDYSYL